MTPPLITGWVSAEDETGYPISGGFERIRPGWLGTSPPGRVMRGILPLPLLGPAVGRLGRLADLGVGWLELRLRQSPDPLVYRSSFDDHGTYDSRVSGLGVSGPAQIEAPKLTRDLSALIRRTERSVQELADRYDRLTSGSGADDRRRAELLWRQAILLLTIGDETAGLSRAHQGVAWLPPIRNRYDAELRSIGGRLADLLDLLGRIDVGRQIRAAIAESEPDQEQDRDQDQNQDPDQGPEWP